MMKLDLIGLVHSAGYRGTSLIRNNPPVGPYRSPMLKAIWWSWGVGGFL